MITLKNKIYNYIMFKGLKNISEILFLKSIKKVQKNFKKNHKYILKLLIVNNSPIIFLKKIKRKRRISREFPYILSKKIRIFLSFKNFFMYIKKRFKRNFYEKFYTEIISYLKDKNNDIIKEKKNLYNYAFTKKKYSKYRWF